MNRTALIATATAAGFTATIEGCEVHVTATGMSRIPWRSATIQAGAKYLGSIAGRRTMGRPVTDFPITMRFSA